VPPTVPRCSPGLLRGRAHDVHPRAVTAADEAGAGEVRAGVERRVEADPTPRDPGQRHWRPAASDSILPRSRASFAPTSACGFGRATTDSCVWGEPRSGRPQGVAGCIMSTNA